MRNNDRQFPLSLPFGMHQDTPIVDLPRKQPDYVRWLLQQHWFPQRFPDHAEALKIAGHRPAEGKTEERTPEHNKLQNRFLDPAYARAFLKVAVGAKEITTFEAAVDSLVRESTEGDDDIRQSWIDGLVRTVIDRQIAKRSLAASRADEKFREIADALSKGANVRRLVLSTPDEKVRGVTANVGLSPYRLAPFALLEKDNVDVTLVTWTTLSHYIRDMKKTKVMDLGELDFNRGNLKIEVKPTVSDDYPMVLRQMLRSKSDFLLVGTFEAHGASRAEFVEIFKRSKIAVIFHQDVLASMERDRLYENEIPTEATILRH